MYCRVNTDPSIFKMLLKFDSPVKVDDGEFSINENHHHSISFILDVVSLPIPSDVRIAVMQGFLEDFKDYEFETIEALMLLKYVHLLLHLVTVHSSITKLFFSSFHVQRCEGA